MHHHPDTFSESTQDDATTLMPTVGFRPVLEESLTAGVALLPS